MKNIPEIKLLKMKGIKFRRKAKFSQNRNPFFNSTDPGKPGH
jgi:hypothetical protein